MTDCPNAEMRDRLPELLHDRLDPAVHAAVLAHVDECAECRAELALLAEIRVSLSSGILVPDTAQIARGVVARTVVARSAATDRRPWLDWRLAAAVAVIAVGGASLVTIVGRRAPYDSVPTVPVQIETETPSPQSVRGQSSMSMTKTRASVAADRVTPETSSELASTSELAAAGDVNDLSESELRALLKDLDTIEAVPSTEPEPVAVRVNLPGRGGSD